MYEIEFAEGVSGDLANLRAYERSHILDEIELQLQYEPTRQTRNQKTVVWHNPAVGTYSTDLGIARW